MKTLLLIFSVLLSFTAEAYPFCNTNTAKEIRASLFGTDLTFNLFVTVLPFIIFSTILYLIYHDELLVRKKSNLQVNQSETI